MLRRASLCRVGDSEVCLIWELFQAGIPITTEAMLQQLLSPSKGKKALLYRLVQTSCPALLLDARPSNFAISIDL